MDEAPTEQPEQREPVESKTLTEDINEFNQALEDSIAKLNDWKINLLNIQEQFVEKLKQKTLGMKIR